MTIILESSKHVSKFVSNVSTISTTLIPKLKHCLRALSEHARSTRLPRVTSGIKYQFQSIPIGFSSVQGILKQYSFLVHFIHSMNQGIFNWRLKMLVLMPLYHIITNPTQFTDIYSQKTCIRSCLKLFQNLGFISWSN